MRGWLERLSRGEHLRRDEAAAAMRAIMDGEASDAQIAGFLVGLRAKGETVDEIVGCAEAMRERAVPMPGVDGGNLIDLCGTGGDGSGTLNVSTLASLVVAGEGVPVAKHGNRSISSRCGSADLLERLGVQVDVPPEVALRCLRNAGIAFLFAPRMHPAVGRASRARRELGIRTIFNLLGPLTNPAGARRQLLGVYDGARLEMVARVAAELGSERVLVVHGAEGLDEISLSGPTRVAELKDGMVRTYELRPEDAGLSSAPLDAIRGGDPPESARQAEGILAGEPGPRADIVALNAGAALLLAGAAESLRSGVDRARRGLREGRAAETLERLRRASREAAG